MRMYPELAQECASRQKNKSYIDIIPVSVQIDYINPSGKILYKKMLISGGLYTSYYPDKIIKQIEAEYNLPLRRKD